MNNIKETCYMVAGVIGMALIFVFIVLWCLLTESLDERTRKMAAERLTYERSQF